MMKISNCHELIDRKSFEFRCMKNFIALNSIVHADEN